MTRARRAVLLTGATGFIGFHIASRLVRDKSLQVICVVRKEYNEDKINALKGMGITIREGDFLDQALLENIFNDYQVRYVVHLAAMRGAGAGLQEAYKRVNEKGTEVLLGQSLKGGVSRFVYCSSVGVYGTIPGELPAGIETGLKGDNLYHQSKITAEGLVKKYSARGLNTCIVRPTITYGQGDNGFPATLVDLVKKRHFILCARDVRIHLLDVAYLADLIYCLVKKERLYKNTFIAADRDPVLLKDLVNRIYWQFHGVKYPAYLKMPGFLFDLAALMFKTLKLEKWLVRILLVSHSWYYDTSALMEECIEIKPMATEENFLLKMCLSVK